MVICVIQVVFVWRFGLSCQNVLHFFMKIQYLASTVLWTAFRVITVETFLFWRNEELSFRTKAFSTVERSYFSLFDHKDWKLEGSFSLIVVRACLDDLNLLFFEIAWCDLLIEGKFLFQSPDVCSEKVSLFLEVNLKGKKLFFLLSLSLLQFRIGNQLKSFFLDCFDSQ